MKTNVPGRFWDGSWMVLDRSSASTNARPNTGTSNLADLGAVPGQFWGRFQDSSGMVAGRFRDDSSTLLYGMSTACTTVPGRFQDGSR